MSDFQLYSVNLDPAAYIDAEKYVEAITNSTYWFNNLEHAQQQSFCETLGRNFSEYKEAEKSLLSIRHTLETSRQAGVISTPQPPPSGDSGGRAYRLPFLFIKAALRMAITSNAPQPESHPRQDLREQAAMLEIKLEATASNISAAYQEITAAAVGKWNEDHPGIMAEYLKALEGYTGIDKPYPELEQRFTEYLYRADELTAMPRRNDVGDVRYIRMHRAHQMEDKKIKFEVVKSLLGDIGMASMHYNSEKEKLVATFHAIGKDYREACANSQVDSESILKVLIEELCDDEMIRSRSQLMQQGMELDLIGEEILLLEDLRREGLDRQDIEEKLKELIAKKQEVETNLERLFQGEQGKLLLFCTRTDAAFNTGNEVVNRAGELFKLDRAATRTEQFKQLFQDKVVDTFYGIAGAANSVRKMVYHKANIATLGAAANLTVNVMNPMMYAAPVMTMATGAAAALALDHAKDAAVGAVKTVAESADIAKKGIIGAKYSVAPYDKPSDRLRECFGENAEHVHNLYVRNLTQLDGCLAYSGLRDDSIQQQYDLLNADFIRLANTDYKLTADEVKDIVNHSFKHIVEKLIPKFEAANAARITTQFAAAMQKPQYLALQRQPAEQLALTVPGQSESEQVRRNLDYVSSVEGEVVNELQLIMQIVRNEKISAPDHEKQIYLHKDPTKVFQAIESGDIVTFRRYLAESLLRGEGAYIVDTRGNTVLHYIFKSPRCFDILYDALEKHDKSGLISAQTAAIMVGGKKNTLAEIFNLTQRNNAGDSALKILVDSGNKVMLEKALKLIEHTVSTLTPAELKNTFYFLEEVNGLEASAKQDRGASWAGAISNVVKGLTNTAQVSVFQQFAAATRKLIDPSLAEDEWVKVDLEDVPSELPPALDPQAREQYDLRKWQFLEKINSSRLTAMEKNFLTMIVCGNHNELGYLLRNEKDFTRLVNENVPGFDTPLYIATVLGLPEVVRVLMENGADANKATPDESSILIEAAKLGYDEVVNVLLRSRKDAYWSSTVDIGAKDLNTALHYMIKNNLKSSLTEYIASIKLNLLNTPNNAKETPLHLLLETKNSSEILSKIETNINGMLRYGSMSVYTIFKDSIFMPNASGKNPLQIAAENGNIAFLKNIETEILQEKPEFRDRLIDLQKDAETNRKLQLQGGGLLLQYSSRPPAVEGQGQTTEPDPKGSSRLKKS